MASPSVTLSLLGPLRVEVDGAPVAGFRTDKVRALLAYLAVEADRPQPRSALAGLLWPDMPEETALRNLRKTLHRLRETLDAAIISGSDSPLISTRQAIQLNQDVWTVDITTFRQLLATVAGHAHRSLHLCPPCLDALTRGVELYAGELLAGFGLSDAEPFEEWLLLKREMVLHQALQALYDLAAAHLTREEYEPAYGCAARQIELDPGREEAHQQALRALALNGQRSEALASFERYRQTLLETFGVEPSEGTVALAAQIRQGTIMPTVQTVRHPEASAALRPANLPTHFTPFFGRETELLQLAEYLRDPEYRLLSILGPGGVGKTRLAARAVELVASRSHFRDGIVFVSLAGVQSAAQLPAALVSSLGLDLSEERDPRTQLLDYLRPRESLLVLDNFEQLLDGTDLLLDVLAAAPGLRLIVTSRLPLDLLADQRLVLEGLEYPGQEDVVSAGSPWKRRNPDIGQVSGASSVQLFTQAIRRRRPDFELSASNAQDVLRICRLVQGMPLALELAAPWVQTMDLAAIGDAIEQNLAVLATSARDVPDRHRSMEAVLAGSWRLLSYRDQVVLAYLSLFRGPFGLEAAAAVAGVTILDLATLVDRCLVGRASDGQYHIHELLRQYGERMLRSQFAADVDGVWERYSSYYLDLLAANEGELYGHEPRRAVSVLLRHLPNVRRAWQRAVEHLQVKQLLRSLDAVARFWDLVSMFDEALATLSHAAGHLEADLDADPSGQRFLVRLLVWQAHFLEVRRSIDEGLGAAERALALAERWGDGEGAAEARGLLGEILPHRGEYALATMHLERAREYCEMSGTPQQLARTLRRLGTAHWRASAFPPGEQYLDRARAAHEQLGDYWELARVYSSLAGIAFQQGNVQQALSRAQESLRLYRATDDHRNVATIRGRLALVYQQLGRSDMALEYNFHELEMCRELGDRHGTAVALGNRAYIYLESEDLEEALHNTEAALQIEEDLGDAWEAARHRAQLASIYHRQGKPALARAEYDWALPVLRAREAPYFLVDPLLQAAELELDLGHHDEAATLVAEAVTLARELELEDKVQESQALEAKIAAISLTGG